MKRGIIFDLDGTLLNSLVDIADAVNYVLEQNQIEVHPFDSYKNFIGNGIEVLARKALPQDLSEERFQVLFEEIKASYLIRQNVRTAPYDGMIETLKELQGKGVKLAILSNKPDEFVEPTVKRYFPDIQFKCMYGSREGVAKKPNPEAVFGIIKEMNLQVEDCIFVGDTATDILTGKNTGIKSIGVLWGFRNREELESAGANVVIDHPSEILSQI